ncbi:unnamed protein product [Clonostachys rosea f. rosea IK726]|uniref:Uncharacterized protein n=1 Tax=Clonostachys rosea f. rosea IK726 TaxID=1349383 RepID=A0ACA9UFJ4_BIOOC|nr:unnamed protein product [Clonostachys rosea f. rosea IK726]
MAELPKTMKAWIITRAGKPADVLQLKTNWPMPPSPKAGEVLVQVSYAALNPGDIKMMATMIPWKGKAIAGYDYAGEVIQLGPSARASDSDIRVGTIVAGTVPLSYLLTGYGTLAEYMILPADQIVEVPSMISESVAAGVMGIAGQTAASIVAAAGLRKGDNVLVNGASGGVGSILIQALHGMGIQIMSVCSARNLDLVLRLGGGEALDYKSKDSIYDYLTSLTADPTRGPFDAIIDCVGDDTLFHRSPGYLKGSGKFLSIEGGPWGGLTLKRLPVVLGGTPRPFVNVFSKPSTASMNMVVGWIEKGWIKELPVDSTFQMDDAIEAFEKLGTQRAVGKIFVKVQ